MVEQEDEKKKRDIFVFLNKRGFVSYMKVLLYLFFVFTFNIL